MSSANQPRAVRGVQPLASTDIVQQQGLGEFQRAVSRNGVSVCLSGIDGSGKTTLAEQLVSVLASLGVPTKRLHFYRWYKALFFLPVIITYNKYFGRRGLILDRNIYDNVAVLFSRHPRLSRFLTPLVWVLRTVLPPCDHSIYIRITLEEALSRRPNLAPLTYEAMSKAYEVIVPIVDYKPVSSNEQILSTVLQYLIDKTTVN